MTPPPLSPLFVSKKAQILELLAIPDEEYTDKSPKGSVDAPIVDLIREINRIDGLVTTSSCSGRVSVFVEGTQNQLPASNQGRDGVGEAESTGLDDLVVDDSGVSKTKRKVRGGPSGKGGGRWLFVSHDPLDLPSPSPPSTSDYEPTEQQHGQQKGERQEGYFTRLCGLQRSSTQSWSRSAPSSEHSFQKTPGPASAPAPAPAPAPAQIPRLIHLSFSPLILHVLTATLQSHARPLLSAAVNAGFRESGVQSLSALPHHDQAHPLNDTVGPGTMVGIRTAGLSFDTVIGVVRPFHHDDDDDENPGEESEVMEAVVSEEYLAMCFGVVNERFKWNEGRKDRLRAEIREAFGRVERWEGKEERRQRKMEEGLRRREELEREKKRVSNGAEGGDGVIVTGETSGDTLDNILHLNTE